jgi:hypothetical protein
VTLCSPIRHRRQGEKMLASEPAEGETTTATTTTTGKASNVEQLLTGWCNVGEHLHPEGDENMDEFDYDQQWLRHVLQGQT